MKHNYRNILLCFAFISILLYPTVDKLFGFTSWIPNNERRQLTAFPNLKLQNLGEFIDDFDKYFKDNFGGRNLLVYGYCFFKYKILNSSPYPEDVIIGQDDWLYLGNAKGRIFDEHSGLYLFSKKALNRIKKNIVKNKNWAETKGMKYYLFIAPDKYTVYPEFLPASFSKKLIDRNLDNLIDFLKPEINIIDVRKELQNAKKKEKLYAKADSHWNDYGAFIAYQILINHLKKDFPIIEEARTESNFEIIKSISNHKSTADMINAHRFITDEEIIFRSKTEKLEKVDRRLPIPDNYNLSKNGYEIRYKTVDGNKIKILVFRDSFSNRLMKFLSLHFEESIYISNFHKFSKKIIEIEQPDIILHQIVERNLPEALLNY